eukprot:3674688-Prymnesium_polylepis.2
MQHTIDEGNRLFKGTPDEKTWMINCDRLSSWWEVEAQDYLEKRGFKDRQVRAWGDCNENYWRYHKAVPGDRPELCALDFSLFNDFTFAIKENIKRTGHLPIGDKRRYDNGTPQQLSSAMRRTWKSSAPLSHRTASWRMRKQDVM